MNIKIDPDKVVTWPTFCKCGKGLSVRSGGLCFYCTNQLDRRKKLEKIINKI